MLTLIGGVLLMILPGSTFVTGNITPYIASYYGIKVEACANILPSFTLFNAMFVPVGAYCATNFHYPRVQLAVGLTVGIAVLYFASTAKAFWLFWLLYVAGFVII